MATLLDWKQEKNHQTLIQGNKIIQTENEREREELRTLQSLRDLWDNRKWSNLV